MEAASGRCRASGPRPRKAPTAMRSGLHRVEEGVRLGAYGEGVEGDHVVLPATVQVAP